MPFGRYKDMADCISQNQEKSNPEAFCAWLHKEVTGAYPAEMAAPMPADAWATYLVHYSAMLSKGESEKVACEFADKQLLDAGWEQSRAGYIKRFEAPKMRTVANIPIFSAGKWTDSMGTEREWTNEDLESMLAAFQAGVPLFIPLKAGHTSDDFNDQLAKELKVPVSLITGEMGSGQLSLGKLIALDRKGNMLFGTFSNVPDVIASLIEGGQFKSVSAEIEDTIGEFGPAITGIALLGAELPAVDTSVLDRVAVFAARDGANIYTFSVSDDFNIDELRTEFADIKARLSEIVKGKRGAPVFRALFSNLNGLFDQLIKRQHTELQEGEMDMANILAALGLDAAATEEQILQTIEALKLKATEQPPEGMKTEFSKMSGTIKEQADKIAKLERNERIAGYEDTTRLFTAIEGDPHELATSLADLEEKAGKEESDKLVAHYTKVNELSAVVIKPKGSEQKSNDEDVRNTHAFAVKVQERAKIEGITFQKALVREREADPKGYREYADAQYAAM